MAENMQADFVQSRQAGFVRCCLRVKSRIKAREAAQTTEIKIKLVSFEDVKGFVRRVNELDCEADLSIGKYTIDAKSIMGIFSLDLSRQLTLTIHSDNCGSFLDEIADCIVK